MPPSHGRPWDLGRAARILILVSVLLLSVAVISAADSEESDALEEGQTFLADGIRYSVLKDTEKVCARYLESDLVHVVVPAEVKDEEGNTYKVSYVDFYDQKNLRTAVLSDGIEGIGPQKGGDGFCNCYNLTDVVIPDSVKWIGEDAFDRCYSLKSLYIPDSVSKIIGSPFANSGLTSIRLPENPEFTTLTESMLDYCYCLQSITIPSNVTSIESWSFTGCDSITQLVIPENVKNLSDYALSDAKNLIFVDLRCDESTKFGYHSLVTSVPSQLLKIKTSIAKDLLLKSEAVLEENDVGPDLEYGYGVLSGNTHGTEISNHAWRLVNGHLEVWAVSPENTSLEGSDCFCVVVEENEGDWSWAWSYEVSHLIRDVEFINEPSEGKYLITEIGNDVFYWGWQDSIVLPEGFITTYGDGIQGTRIVKMPATIESMRNPGDTMTLIVPDKEMSEFYVDGDTCALIIEVGSISADSGPLYFFKDGGSIRGTVFLAGTTGPVITTVISDWDFDSMSKSQYYSDTDGKVWHIVYNEEKGAYEWEQDASLRTVVFDLNDGSGVQLRKVVSDGFTIGSSDFVSSTKGNFAGWFSEDGKFVSPDALVSEIFGDSYLVTLHAKWDGAFVVLGTGVTATYNGDVFTRYATVPLGSSLTVAFDEGYALYCAAGFDVSGSLYSPVEGVQAYSITAKEVGYTLVTLDLSGGESDCSSMKVTVGGDLPATYAQPTRAGYDFAGYENVQHVIIIGAVDGTVSPSFVAGIPGYTDSDGLWINENSAVTLTAVWIAHTTKVVLHNMGVVDDDELTATYDEDFPYINLNDLGVKSDNARFEGYYDNDKFTGSPINTGGYTNIPKEDNPLFDGYTWKGDIETYDLYAKWVPKYTLFVDDGNGIEISGDEIKEVSTPGKTGYTFGGWLLTGDADYTVAKYGDSEETVTAPITKDVAFSSGGYSVFVKSLSTEVGGKVYMKSQWIPIEYGVHFELDGGSGSYPDKIVTYDVAFSVPAPVKDGFMFAGWTLSGDSSAINWAEQSKSEAGPFSWMYSDEKYGSASGPLYVRNLSVDPAEVATLTANWTVGSYKVTFDANSDEVEGAMSDMVLNFGLSYNLNWNEYSKTGHSFTGWATEPKGEVVYENHAEVKDLASEIDETVTLYAVWKVDQHTFTFTNTGVTKIDPITLDYGAEVQKPKDPEYPKYDFAGWLYNGEITEVPSTMPAYDMEFKAKWEPASYTVSFDANTGNGSMKDETIVYFQSTTLYANEFSKVGHKFTGWNTEKDGSGTPYTDKAIVSDIGDTVLYAQWEPLSYTVVFHSNPVDPSQTEETKEQKFNYGVTKKLSKNTFAIDGFDFDSWNTEKDGKGKAYADAQKVSNLCVVDGDKYDLYAQWVPKTQTIVLDKGEHGLNDGVAYVKYGDGFAVIDVPVKCGDGFAVSCYGVVSASVKSVRAVASFTPVLYPDGTFADSPYVKNGKWAYASDGLTLTAMFDVIYDATVMDAKGSEKIRTVSYDGSPDILEHVFDVSADDRRAVSIDSVLLRVGDETEDVEMTYSFDQDKQAVAVSSQDGTWGDLIINVNYVPLVCTVTLHAGDGGQALGSGTYDYGTEVAIEAVADEHYAFVKWSDDSIEAKRTFEIQGDVELTATFTQKQYTLTLLAGDGGLVNGEKKIEEKHYYGDQVPVSAVPDEGFEFDRWSDDGTAEASRTIVVGSDIEYTAYFKEKILNVTWKDWNGTVLYEGTAKYGETPAYGGPKPYYEGHDFIGWDPTVSAIFDDAIYTAVYDVEMVTYVWYNDDGSVAYTATVPYGETPVYEGPEPTRDGYVFVGWEETEPGIFVPVFADPAYVVTFLDWDGSVLSSSEYAYGEVPVYAGTPYREGYDFVGWDPAIVEVTADATYIATYEIQMITYIWYNDDGSVAYTETIPYGETPVYEGPEPSKDGYVFVGWEETEPGIFVPVFQKESSGVPAYNIGFGITLGYDKPKGDVDHTGYWNLSFDFGDSIPDGGRWPYGNGAVMAVKFYFSDGGNLADMYAYNYGAGNMYSSEYVVVPVFEFNGMPYVEDVLCTPDLWPVGPDGTMYAYPVQAEAVLYTGVYNEDDDFDKK